MSGSQPKSIFRVDGSSKIGGGHLVRCLTLADALAREGWSVVFACGAGALEAVPQLGRSKFAVHILDDDDRLRPQALLRTWPTGPDLLVVDHYGLDAEYERHCRAWAKRILVIDDLADRPHDADVLVDQTAGRSPGDYRRLLPSGAVVLAGSAFALVRPEFAQRREDALKRQEAGHALSRIHVSFGFGDPGTGAALALDGILGSRLDVDVDVVLASGAAQRRMVEERIALRPDRFRLHVDVADMAGLLAEADLAIGGGGTTAWERCCLGLPTVLVAIADNQLQVCEALRQAGAAVALGALADVDAGMMAAALIRLAHDPAERSAMARKAAVLCDGLGTRRVLQAVAPERSDGGEPVWLRPASAEDGDTLLAWQQAPETRRHFRNSAVPDPETHRRWLVRKLADPGCLLNIVMHGDRPAGTLRLDRTQTGGGSAGYEVSILVAPDQHRRGVGGAALAAARRLVPDARLVAEVLPQNFASLRLFESAGYVAAGDVLVSLPSARERSK